MKWVMLYENGDHELVETVISNVISSLSLPILDKNSANWIDEHIKEKNYSTFFRKRKSRPKSRWLHCKFHLIFFYYRIKTVSENL